MHLNRRTDRPVRIVLVRDRRPEQREDAVAEHLVDRSTEALDLRDEQGKRAVDEPFHSLGVEMFGQRRIAHEVGEHDGHHPPLLHGTRPNLVPTERAEACTLGEGLGARDACHQPPSVRHVSRWADERTVTLRYRDPSTMRDSS